MRTKPGFMKHNGGLLFRNKTATEYGAYNNMDYTLGDIIISGGVRYDDNSMHGSQSTPCI